MFFGLIVEPEKMYATRVISPFTLSNAVLDVNEIRGTSDVQLIVNIDNMDYIICNLNKVGRVQVSLDLKFSEGDEISFRSDGGTIHLSGYYADEYDFESDIEKVTTTSLITDERGNIRITPMNQQRVNMPNGVQTRKRSYKGTNGVSQTSGSTDEDTSGEETSILTPIKPIHTVDETENSILKKPKQPIKPTDGIIIAEIEKGNGTEATMGKKVRIYYERINGSSKESIGEFWYFTIGAGDETKKWLVGVEGMRVGGKRKIFCSAEVEVDENGPQPRKGGKTYVVDLINVFQPRSSGN